MPTPDQLQALVSSGQLEPGVAERLGTAPRTPQQEAGADLSQLVVEPSAPAAPLPMPPTVEPSTRRPPGFGAWIQEGLQAYGLGLAGMDPIRELERIDERMAMAEAERDHAIEDARLAAGGYEVIMEQGGDMPGQVVGDRDGRVYWVPAYGPAAVEPIEIPAGEDPSEVMQFAQGPAPDREMMMAALAGKAK